MFHSRKTNNRINKRHERALKLVYNDYESTFEDLLTKDGSFTIHHYNIQTLAIELCKGYNNISQTILQELFTRNNNGYYLRSKSDFFYSANYNCTKRIKLNQIFWSNYLELNPKRTKKHNFVEHFQKRN